MENWIEIGLSNRPQLFAYLNVFTDDGFGNVILPSTSAFIRKLAFVYEELH